MSRLGLFIHLLALGAFICALLLVLSGCGSSTPAPELSAASSDWPIVIPIYEADSGHIRMPAVINGNSFDCVFDTGAPGLWVLPEVAPEWDEVTVTVGNYERTDAVAWNLTDNKEWTECLIGLPFFEGATDFEIDVVNNELRVRI